jgi:hypothetical protein
VRPEREADPSVFFGGPGESGRSAKRNWKALQLCKQVERSATATLASECDSAALVGAAIASVEPAPDASRLRVTVVLVQGKNADDLADARASLMRSAPAFREDVGRTIHRKRVPEIVFDVWLAAEVSRG